MAPGFLGGPVMVRTTRAPSVVVGASAARMGLAALAAFTAFLFRFCFSAGVSLGASRMSPGITLWVPATNWTPVSSPFPETSWPCDISRESVVNFARLSSKPVESWNSWLLTSSYLRVSLWLFWWRTRRGLISAQVCLIINKELNINNVINLAFF